MPRALNKTVMARSLPRSEGEDGASRHQAVDERRRAHAEGAFEGPTPVTKVSKVMKRTVGALRRRAGIPRRSRPPPVRFSVFDYYRTPHPAA
jgi:hypothetical protein